jgi:hypothetical protein
MRIRVVKPFDIASAFIEQHERKRPLDELKRAFAKSPAGPGYPPLRVLIACGSVEPARRCRDVADVPPVTSHALAAIDSISEATAAELQSCYDHARPN